MHFIFSAPLLILRPPASVVLSQSMNSQKAILRVHPLAYRAPPDVGDLHPKNIHLLIWVALLISVCFVIKLLILISMILIGVWRNAANPDDSKQKPDFKNTKEEMNLDNEQSFALK